MFRFFKKRPPRREMTFKARVQHFWDWYVEVAPRFYEVIEAHKSPSLALEVSAKIDELFGGFAWVFGRGEGSGHSFTLSGEGNPHHQFLTMFWHSLAPNLQGWTFHPARQPGAIEGNILKIGERDFDPIEFWITPYVRHDREKLDITAWHPGFDQMAENDRWTVLYLFLDEVLGEYGTEQWIGEIQLSSSRLADSIPLKELSEFVKKTETETGWKKLPPGEATVLYHSERPHNRFPRGDIVVGSTMHPKLIQEYINAEGNLEDPLASKGADYVYVSFDSGVLPKGKESSARGVIEDALDAALRKAKSGRLLGGALGTQCAYIDLLLFDDAASLDIVRSELRKHERAREATINYFAREKRQNRIVM
jgi:hypothetical protein